MKKIPLACCIILWALASIPVYAQPVKIGYVNVVRIESEAAIAKQAAETSKREFAPREQQLLEMQKQGNALQSDLEKNSATMPPAERQTKEQRFAAMAQQYQQMQRGLLEDVEARKRESFVGFQAEVTAIIKRIAEAGKFDLILQQAVYNNAQLDITDQVMKEIAKRAGGGR